MEDYTDEKIGEKKFAPVAKGWIGFTRGQMSPTMHAGEFLVTHQSCYEFGLILWRTREPIFVMTDNEAFTMFVPTKHIPLTIEILRPAV